MQTTVIALANQKGGVGKTTTAINLSACLAEKGHKTLLVDLDPQCNSTSGLGVVQEEGRSVYGPLLGEATLEEMIVDTRLEALHVVPAEIDLAGAEVDIARADRYLHRFKDVLSPILDDGRYEFVFVDCPPSLGILTMNGLAAARAAVIPMQCEYYALEGLTVISRLIDQLRQGGANPELNIEGVLMTMHDSRTKLSNQVVAEVRDYFGAKVYDIVIPRNVRLGEAPSYGMPIVEYDPHCPGARAYREFADEFLERMKSRAEQPAPQAPEPEAVTEQTDEQSAPPASPATPS